MYPHKHIHQQALKYKNILVSLSNHLQHLASGLWVTKRHYLLMESALKMQPFAFPSVKDMQKKSWTLTLQ